MSITDELREYASTRISPNKGMLLAIADRIEEQFDRCCELWERTAQDAIHAQLKAEEEHDDLLDLLRDVALMDADGEYIHIGDVMVYADGNTCPMKVVALVPPSVFLTDDGPRYANMCRHRPTTVEDVLQELEGELYEAIRERFASKVTISEYDEKVAQIIAEYAAKLRLASDKQ